MAGGKATPRQKMINLMYLIFIAMLALNMSKEVLAAFGIMNEKLEASNEKTTAGNDAFLESLGTKASEDAAKYDKLYQNAQSIKSMSQEYYDYLETLKTGMTEGLEDATDYARMDNSDFLDQTLFQGDNLSEEGKKFTLAKETKIYASKSGFDGFMGKPLDPDRFPEQIKRLLAGEQVWEWQ